jgi:hypothetical protein
VLAVVGLVGACSGGDDTDQPAASEVTTPPATTATVPAEPVGIIALGHSALTGENSDPDHPGEDAEENSWATGTNPEVQSIYERLVEARPETEGHVDNAAQGGAAADELRSQAGLALNQVPNPELVVIETIDDDIRCDGTDAEHLPEFGAAVDDALDAITTRAPDATILLVGQFDRPRVDFVQQLVAEFPDQREALGGSGPCDFFDEDGRLQPEHFAYLSGLIDDYEAEEAQVCQSYPQCFTTGELTASYREQVDDYSDDHNHRNVQGLSGMAEVVWPRVEEILGLS